MEEDKNKFNTYIKNNCKNIVFVLIGILFVIPIAGMFFGFIFTSLGCPKDRLIDLYMFDLDNLKDFYSFWITLFGVPAIGYNIYQNQKRITNQDKQIIIQSEQLNIQSEQLNIQKEEQRENRFIKGTELLGSENEATIIGGATILYSIAREFRNEYINVICIILISHIKIRTVKPEYRSNNTSKPSSEIQRIFNYLFRKDDEKTQIADSFHIDIQDLHLAGCTLEGSDFTSSNLKSINLENSEGKNAIFRMTDLQGANLQGANLQGANFVEAKLRGANLRGANLQDANFRGADLQEADLTHSKLKNAMFTNSNLDKANFTNSIDADISNCKSKINIIM